MTDVPVPGGSLLAFDVDVATLHVRQSSARMAKLMDQVGPFGLRLEETPSVFAALAEAIVYQQLTAKAAGTIFGRVRALFPDEKGGFVPERVPHVSDDALRIAGLSRAKLLALRDLAERSTVGTIPTLAEVHRMEDDAIVERLTEVRGIGRWTVEMLLIFRLGRPDVFPVDDYGVRKGFASAFKKRELPDRKELAKYAARWKPYRTVASWYLWRALDPKAATK